MNHFLSGVARAVAETFDLPEPIVEIGSRQVPGQEEIAELRPLFAGKSYIGVDMAPGLGVDLVANIEALPQASGSVGTVIAMSTLEHVAHFWRGLEEIYRILRPDGAVLISCPFYFHIHSYPSDYWRFTPEALDVLLDRFPTRILGWHGPARRPANVWALAFGEARAPVSADQLLRYRALMKRYAHQPLSWKRRLRYRLGRVLGGRRPFAPYFDRDRWEIECRTSTVS